MINPSLFVVLLALVPAGAGADPSVFACNLNALTKDERALHAARGRALIAAVRERRELADGYGFRLPAASLPAAAEWVALERRCCPFFRFALEIEAEGPLWLRITGPPGVKPFMRAEFGS